LVFRDEDYLEEQIYQEKALEDKLSYKYIMKNAGEARKESLQTELNNKLVNDIVLYKIQQKMKDSEEKMRFLQGKDKFYKETKIITKPTLATFSTFNSVFKNAANIINYERMYSKINSEKLEPKKMFDFKD